MQSTTCKETGRSYKIATPVVITIG